DGKDLLAMVVQLGGSDSLCDIGPYAWGDGVVDVEDLKVLAEYIGKEVVDGTLIAHWKLDETGGMTAEDSAGDSDGTVMGGASWRPDGGKVGGALELDGVDDFVLAALPTGLGDGPFSILAWVKGGAADEVLLSGGTADWLYTNPADGSLMTALSSIAGNGVPLFSDVVITDAQWHRIGLVWDGVDRILLVDEQEVARDEQAELAIPNASLMIGVGATAGRFYSGQIDDLRIYRRAVKP
ncbi:MAG: LamG domain-containing protein, partial [Sedimentisphaerales bacterium]|nr:LamG domain-containing protein [Sedimentisphaerales bacterium]